MSGIDTKKKDIFVIKRQRTKTKELWKECEWICEIDSESDGESEKEIKIHTDSGRTLGIPVVHVVHVRLEDVESVLELSSSIRLLVLLHPLSEGGLVLL